MSRSLIGRVFGPRDTARPAPADDPANDRLVPDPDAPSGPEPLPAGATGGGTGLFVRRPILAFVISSLIVIAGLAGLAGVEIRELPDVDRPVVTVTTNYAGASPETIDQEITARVEGAVGRDLQFIRINGTLVGGLVGVTIHLVSGLF